MISTTRELDRLMHALVWRGALMVLLGVGAMAFPEPFLVAALLTVGVIATLFGVYEISIGLSLRPRQPRWRLVLFDGMISVAFGLLTVGAPAISFGVALAAIAVWFALHAGLAMQAARLAARGGLVRRALIAWAGFDLALAVLVATYPAATIFALLFLGAAYAATFGAWQVATGLWLRRLLIHIRSDEYPLPTAV